MNEIENTACAVTGNVLIKNVPPASLDTTNEKIVGIYGLRCRTTNKWYVGQSIDVFGRWEDYRKLRCKNQRKLYHALMKYGYGDFEKILIEPCDKVDWILDYREMYWIKRYNAFTDGYNLTEGGHIGLTFLGMKHTPEAKAKISSSGKGRKLSSESIEKMRKSLTGKIYGPRSLATRRKISESQRGKPGKKPSEKTRRRMSVAIRESMTADVRLKISEAGKGRVPSNETREKLRQSLTGHGTSDETRQKISMANTGKTRTLEVRKRLSESRLGKKRGPYSIKVSRVGTQMSESAKEKMREAWKRRKERRAIVLVD